MNQMRNVAVEFEAYYLLCPDDPETKDYFDLPADLQVRAMNALLDDCQQKVGGGDVTKGEKLLKRWKSIKKIQLPVVSGHPFLTEAAAQAHLDARIAEIKALYGAEAEVAALKTAAPCPDCVPRPPNHYSIRAAYLAQGGKPMHVEVDLGAKGHVTARLAIRMRVETKLHPRAQGAHPPGHGSTARPSSDAPVEGNPGGEHRHDAHHTKRAGTRRKRAPAK
ncbi:MAG: hypothetical protein HZA52_21025 [Planctomycetes bacterium]|nr:hypothetical protein [Planctomycetota bacterium]